MNGITGQSAAVVTHVSMHRTDVHHAAPVAFAAIIRDRAWRDAAALGAAAFHAAALKPVAAAKPVAKPAAAVRAIKRFPVFPGITFHAEPA